MSETIKGPHCPACDLTMWRLYDLLHGSRVVCCAACGWKEGDPLPDISQYVTKSEPETAPRRDPYRVENLVFALLASPREYSFSEESTDIVTLAIRIDADLTAHENAQRKNPVS